MKMYLILYIVLYLHWSILDQNVAVIAILEKHFLNYYFSNPTQYAALKKWKYG